MITLYNKKHNAIRKTVGAKLIVSSKARSLALFPCILLCPWRDVNVVASERLCLFVFLRFVVKVTYRKERECNSGKTPGWSEIDGDALVAWVNKEFKCKTTKRDVQMLFKKDAALTEAVKMGGAAPYYTRFMVGKKMAQTKANNL